MDYSDKLCRPDYRLGKEGSRY
jgi:hypothetical protein